MLQYTKKRKRLRINRNISPPRENMASDLVDNDLEPHSLPNINAKSDLSEMKKEDQLSPSGTQKGGDKSM